MTDVGQLPVSPVHLACQEDVTVSGSDNSTDSTRNLEDVEMSPISSVGDNEGNDSDMEDDADIMLDSVEYQQEILDAANEELESYHAEAEQLELAQEAAERVKLALDREWRLFEDEKRRFQRIKQASVVPVIVRCYANAHRNLETSEPMELVHFNSAVPGKRKISPKGTIKKTWAAQRVRKMKRAEGVAREWLLAD